MFTKSLAVLCAGALYGVALAQPGNVPKSGEANAPNPNRVVLSRSMSVSEAVAGMAKAANATVVVDSAVTGRVTESTAKLPLEQGLALIAKENHAQWRKVYLAENEIPRLSDGRIDAFRLKKAVEAVSTPPPLTIGVMNPATGMMTVSTVAQASTPAMQEWAKSKKAVSLLYVPDGPAGGVKGSLVDDAMPPGGLEAFKSMTPDQRAQWMKDHNATIITSDMSPDERNALLQNVTPDQREDMARKMDAAAAAGVHTVIVMKRSPGN